MSAIRILLEITVANMGVLWDAASLQAMTIFEMADCEVTETIGPRQDPDPAACAAMLFDMPRFRSAFENAVITVNMLGANALSTALVIVDGDLNRFDIQPSEVISHNIRT